MDKVDWEVLKALAAKATHDVDVEPCTGRNGVKCETYWKMHSVAADGVYTYVAEYPYPNMEHDATFDAALRNAFPAILAAHEKDQRVIAAALAFKDLPNEIRKQNLFDALAEFDKAKQS